MCFSQMKISNPLAFPAALATLALILVLSFKTELNGAVIESYQLIQIIPYILVLIGGISGINVFVVLLVGIISGAAIMLGTGQTAATDLLANMGSGAAGMFETSMVAILVANPIAKEMSKEYDITPRKAASLLDTFSCFSQGIIPYGAQMLVAISAAAEQNAVPIPKSQPKKFPTRYSNVPFTRSSFPDIICCPLANTVSISSVS